MIGYMFIGIYLALITYGIKFKGEKAIKLLIVLCFYQNIALMFISSYLNSTQFTVLALMKELYVHAYIMVNIIYTGKIKKRMGGYIIGELVLLGCLSLYGAGTIIGRLSSFRQLYLPFLFSLFAYCCRISEKELKRIALFYTKHCVIACLCGFGEIAIGINLWKRLGIGRYALLKGINNQMHPTGILRSFYTYDLGIQMRRMASVLVDPVILGQLLALGFLISVFWVGLYRTKMQKLLFSSIIGIGMILTLAKGGIIIAAVSTCILLHKVFQKRILSGFLFLILSVLIMIYFVNVILAGSTGSVRHYKGLLSGLSVLQTNLFGHGIGSAGNLAIGDGETNPSLMLGAESYIGSLVAQLGIIGIILNGCYWWSLLAKLYKKVREDRFFYIIFISVLILFATSFVNYTAISFSSCFIYLILGTCAISMTHQKDTRGGIL